MKKIFKDVKSPKLPDVDLPKEIRMKKTKKSKKNGLEKTIDYFTKM